MANKSGAGKSNHQWIGGRERMQPGMLALVAVLCIAAIGIGAVLQSSFSKRATGSEAAQDSVRICALCAENVSRVTDDGDAPDWIEVENRSDAPVDLERYGLLLDSNINQIFSFPKLSLAPGERATVYASGEGAGSMRAPFRLPASGGETLVLLNAKGAVADAVTLPELSADERYVLNDGEWQVVSGNAQGTAEVELIADALEISEVMSGNTLYFPDETGAFHDYVEIRNTSGASVNLGGWHLSDASDSLTGWTFPNCTIPANGTVAVHCSGENRTDDPNHLHTDFRLSSDGETVYLTRPDGRTVSAVKVPMLQANQAYSFVNGAWTTELAPTPGMENTRDAANALAAQRSSGLNGVCINEIMASPSAQNSDWIELYNASSAPVDLTGCGLSDDASKPRRYTFPAGTVIQPGQYMGVSCNGDKEGTINGFLNTGFSLSAAGGYTAALSDPNGLIADAVYVPMQYTGIAYGRADGENSFVFFDTATPGEQNAGGVYIGRAAKAVCSVQGGLFKTGDAFAVELSAPAGSRITYTLDSTDPTEASTPYTAPIPISQTTVLRTRVFRDGELDSYIDTQSYIFDARTKNGVYVVSLVSDPMNLTDPETGIMVAGNHENNKQEWEREGSFELFTADGSRVLGQACGVSLHGQSSRDLPIKTFNVFARGIYGDNRFDYPIFHERDYEAYQSLLLRPSGEDYAKTFMRDTLLTSLLGDSELMYQKWELAVVYVDGQYYSLMYIRERINKFSICQFEGWEGMEDDLDIVRGNSSVTQGSNESFKALQRQLDSMDKNTDEAYRLIDANIDIDNYIEYIVTEVYTGNTDLINCRRYRNAKADGKWRWTVFDLDWAFNLDKDSILDWLDGPGVGVRDATDNSFFVACMKNDTFRDRFLTRFGELMATKFATANVAPRIQERYNMLADFLPDYIERWNLNTSKMAGEMQAITEYAKTRPDKLINTYTKDALKLSDADMECYFGAANREIAQTQQ